MLNQIEVGQVIEIPNRGQHIVIETTGNGSKSKSAWLQALGKKGRPVFSKSKYRMNLDNTQLSRLGMTNER